MDFDKVRIASYLLPDPGGEVVRKLLDEIEQLRAVIGTPEVYAGVVTEVLECERDRAIGDVRRLQKLADDRLHQRWDENDEHREKIKQLQLIMNELGSWASAALDDPKVCDELKEVFAKVVEVAE